MRQSALQLQSNYNCFFRHKRELKLNIFSTLILQCILYRRSGISRIKRNPAVIENPITAFSYVGVHPLASRNAMARL